jgi:hypothetical protein
MSDSSRSTTPRTLPTPDEILAQIEQVPAPVQVEERYEEAFTRQAIDIEESYVHLRGLQMHYTHKAGWSVYLAAMMALMIGFQILLLSLVGSEVWSFEKYDWLLPALLVQNLAQVIGLAVIVVKSLFTDVRG